MVQKRIAEIITKLKKVRADNGLSFQRIVELVEQNGDYVSVSTVKRVFEEGSETYGFQYENTLRPIACAVLGIYDDSEAASADEADTMKAIIEYKTERIEELMAKLKQAEEAYTQQLQRSEESYKRRIEFLKRQIELKDSRIDRRDDMIERLLDTILQIHNRNRRPR